MLASGLSLVLSILIGIWVISRTSRQMNVSAMNDLNIAARETASGISQIRSGTQQLNESAQALKATI